MKTDLLRGNIRKQLIFLALPLLLGNILQQFYNTTDSLIIGHFLGSLAFASTGVSGTIMNLFIFVINGFCVGLSVIFAQAYGSGNWKRFRQEMFLSLLIGAVLSLVISACSVKLLRPILVIIQTPEALMLYCIRYLEIILPGLPVTFMYNYFSTILRAVGNTLSSLAALFISVVANIGLDYLFVGYFNLGITGAAFATVLAQLLSAVCCYYYLKRHYPHLMFTQNDIIFSKASIFQILRFGAVSSLHQSSLYIGKILVQGCVNTLGTAGIAAYTATMRIEGVVNSFGDSGSQAMSILISQNYGARDKKRVHEGFTSGLCCLIILCMIMSCIMFIASEQCLRIFLSAEETLSVQYGSSYLRIIACFYVLCFIGNAYVGYFRGIGKVVIPFWGTTLHLSLRVVLSWLLVQRFGLSAIAIATGSGWTLVVVFHSFNYWLTQKNNKETVESI